MQKERAQTVAENPKEQDEDTKEGQSLHARKEAASIAGALGNSADQGKRQQRQPVPASGLVLFMLKNCANK